MSSAFVDPGMSSDGPDAAEDDQATMARSEWYDYANRFVPIENQLMNYATNPDQITTAENNATSATDQAFATQAGTQQREMAGLGIQPTSAQSTEINRNDDLSKSLGEVGAANEAEQATNARQLQILS